MAILRALPEADIISGFKGVIDFYVRDGRAIARRWPAPITRARAPAVQAQYPVFAAASRLWNTLSQEVQAAYNGMASGSTLTGRDLMVKMYINGKSVLPY